MGPYTHLTGDAETSWTRRSICRRVKETAKLHGPVDTFEGGSRRPRNLMDPYINLQEGQGDCETSWTRRYICRRVKETAKPHGPVYKFAGGSRRLRNFMEPYISLKGDLETSWTRR